MTNGATTREPAWGAFFFGSIFGGLLAFTTAAGITATIIGLIFTLVGGSFLAWFQPNKLDDQQRASLLRYMGLLALGLWAGLLLGFLMRGIEDYWIRPAIVAKWQEKFHLNPDDVTRSSAGTSPAIPRPLFQTQANVADFRLALRDLEDERKTNANLTKEDRETLDKLTAPLPSLIAAMEAAEKAKLQDRLSEKGQEALKKIVILRRARE